MDKAERQAFNERNIAEFRSNGGWIASFGDAPVLLLTTTGAKSGLRRTNPMMYLADDDSRDRVYVFASAAGAERDPDWFHNVVAHPNGLTVEMGDATVTADAEVLGEPLRTEVYAVQAGRYPSFATYQAKTSRSIPVIALTLQRGAEPGRPNAGEDAS